MDVPIYHDENGIQYTKESLLKGISNHTEMSSFGGGFGGDAFDVGNGVAVLSNIALYNGPRPSNSYAPRNKKITWIVIHYTAGYVSTRGCCTAVCRSWVKRCTDTPNNVGSADLVVGDDEIMQYSPDIDRYYTHHCGGSYKSVAGGKLRGICYNSNSIGIELCNNCKGKYEANAPSMFFTNAVIKNGIELTRALMRRYNIDRNHICRHYDTAGKLCPGVIGWNEDSGDVSQWHKFLNSL